ncbi:MAG TPA: type II toxin-antitoxin system prevent-host-death family antitoxin [Thermoanaerobaculia bacterium]|nr:type II toxin-antitoxin system prevent-host-death family antitoxin [Thermoanaerobaculia bacterium]
MAGKIGIRELKNRASEIVREVRESQATYVVTVRGEPVAELRPLPAQGIRERRQEEVEQVMAEIDELARRIGRAWRSPKTAVELVEEQRR